MQVDTYVIGGFSKKGFFGGVNAVSAAVEKTAWVRVGWPLWGHRASPFSRSGCGIQITQDEQWEESKRNILKIFL